MAESLPVSLSPLLPNDRIVLLPAYPADVRSPEWEAWETALIERLREEGLDVLVPGGPGSSRVHLAVTAEDGPGRTPTGTRFHATRYSVTLRVHRAEVELRGTHAVDTDPAIARAAARQDLIERIVLALAP